MTDKKPSWSPTALAQREWLTWQRWAAWGVFFLAMTVFFFWYFTDFESSKESSRSMNWLFATLYNIGGKYLVCALCLLAAVGYLVGAVVEKGKPTPTNGPPTTPPLTGG